MDMKNILDTDYKKFLIPEGDVDFDPKRNKKIIDDTITKYELMRAKKQKEYEEQVRERANAVTTYLFDSKAQRKNTPIEEYFGKRTLALLRANKIVSSLQLIDGRNSTKLYERGGE